MVLTAYTCLGHGFCSKCCPQIRHCSICRQPIKPDDRRHVYITFLDPTLTPNEQRAQFVKEKLDSIDSGSPITSVEKAGKKIRKVVELDKEGPGSIDPSIAQGLLDAAKSLDERISPLRELESLKKQALLDARARTALEAEVSRLQWELDESTAKRLETIERHKVVMSEERQNYIQLQKEYTSLNENLKKLEKEYNLKKAKLKTLAKATRHTSPDLHDPDASLHVEPPPTLPNAAAQSYKNKGLSRKHGSTSNSENAFQFVAEPSSRGIDLNRMEDAETAELGRRRKRPKWSE
ncbi:hypothetical protein AX16_008959 [Volvariella volvacea WC 439]|nr:hypothetical protein AX16_008959 [Volvariella volvacea WC 439]